MKGALMLTRKQRELLLFIERKLQDDQVCPSFEEMKTALNLKSKSGIHRLVSALEDRGFIRRLVNKARALEVIKSATDTTKNKNNSLGKYTLLMSDAFLCNPVVPKDNVLAKSVHVRIPSKIVSGL